MLGTAWKQRSTARWLLWKVPPEWRASHSTAKRVVRRTPAVPIPRPDSPRTRIVGCTLNLRWIKVNTRSSRSHGLFSCPFQVSFLFCQLSLFLYVHTRLNLLFLYGRCWNESVISLLSHSCVRWAGIENGWCDYSSSADANPCGFVSAYNLAISQRDFICLWMPYSADSICFSCLFFTPDYTAESFSMVINSIMLNLTRTVRRWTANIFGWGIRI